VKSNLKKVVWGIGELEGWRIDSGGEQTHRQLFQPFNGHEVEEFLEAHAEAGIKNVIWHAGRSVANFRTDHPLLSTYGTVGDSNAAGPGDLRFKKMMEQRCLLEATVKFCRHNDIILAARLAMNRHYGEAYGGLWTSKFFRDHPEYHEIPWQTADGPTGRMCYAFEEVRHERISFLLEMARKGPDILHLDFARQPPMIMYHPRLVDGFKRRTGVDPRKLSILDGERFWDWMRYRSEHMTQFMRELNKERRDYEEKSGRTITIQVRVTDGGFETNLLSGIDLRVWCEEGLFDELFTTPLEWIVGHYQHDLISYISLAHQFDMPLYAGISALPVAGFSANPIRLIQRALDAYEDGADGVALYQTDFALEHPSLSWCLRYFSDPQGLKEIADAATISNRLGGCKFWN
jgi:hypothetical protein